MALILSGNVASATAAVGYNVANSCRFNDGDSAYMHKTPGSAGNQITFTISLWCKRGALGTKQTLFSAVNDANNETECHFETDDTLNFRDNEGGSFQIQKRTTQVFRDCSAWYHLVFSSVSGTQKIWVNGVEVTSWTTDTNGTGTATWNDDNVMTVGAKNDGSSPQDYFDGYIAEFVSIDGLTLTPTSFGEFDEDSPTIWKPIDVSGLTFGTNGFYLDFEDSANLGNDANGGTDLTEVNLAATDQASDSPTNNFATLNPIYRYTNNMTYTEGNVKVTGAGNSWQGANSTFYINKGKWFFEVKFSSATDIGNYYIGWTTAGDYNISEPYDNGIHYYNADSGEIYADSSALTTADYGTFANGDVMGMALDYDNSLLTVYKNGSALVSDYDFSSATTTAKGGNYVTPTVAHYGSGVVEWNFGNPSWALSSAVADAAGYGAFEYAVPSGYYSLCTKNLATYG